MRKVYLNFCENEHWSACQDSQHVENAFNADF